MYHESIFFISVLTWRVSKYVFFQEKGMNGRIEGAKKNKFVVMLLNRNDTSDKYFPPFFPAINHEQK